MELYTTETSLVPMLNDIRQTMMATGERPERIKTVFGEHGMSYGFDEDGDGYVTIGFVLPRAMYAEIEDGTYGSLQGFRFYLGVREDEQ